MGNSAEASLGPLPARLQHGRMELVAETVKDSRGAPAQPYRAVDTIEIMLRAGTITKEMAAAADRFRIAFRIAHLDALRAADMARTPGTGGRPAEPPTWARQLVLLAALGILAVHFSGRRSTA